eukprot:1193034-Rhodomonas_salina.2
MKIDVLVGYARSVQDVTYKVAYQLSSKIPSVLVVPYTTIAVPESRTASPCGGRRVPHSPGVGQRGVSAVMGVWKIMGVWGLEDNGGLEVGNTMGVWKEVGGWESNSRAYPMSVSHSA